ncbi:MAG: glycosyltransferase [Pseudomonadota bacterium]
MKLNIGCGHKIMLDIILRTCSRYESQVHAGSRIHPKNDVLIRCLKSLRNSIHGANCPEIKLAIIDDHSDSHIAEGLQKSCDVFISLDNSTGNSASLHAVYDYAKESCSDLIYFVEDDYLHELGAIQEMIDFYYLAKDKLPGRELAIHPVDYPDRYRSECLDQCFIVPGKNRYWRTIGSTTGTFFVSRWVFLRYWHLFNQFADCGSEEQTINKIWRGINGVNCFSPIPTLAYHLQAEENLPLYSDYKPLWDNSQC